VFTVGWHGSPIKFEEQCVHCWMAWFTNKVWLVNHAIQQWTHYSSNFIGEPCHITVDTLFFKLYWWTVPSNSGHIVLQTLLVNHAIQQWTHYSSNIIGEPCHPTVNTLFFKLYWWTMPSNSEHIVLQTLLVNRAIQQWTHCSSNFIGETCHPTAIKFEEQCVHCWMARFTNKVWKIMCSLLHGAVHQ
jgi:hypothetical protein